MKFTDFIKIYQAAQIIDSSTFSLTSKNPAHLRRQVREWVKKGYLFVLRRGKYIFSEEYRKQAVSGSSVANALVTPSYLSLEFVLGFYGLIPEKVTVFTSITTKKTAGFKNVLGAFDYRSVKEKLFFGYKKITESEREFFIALPEKALLDYFYLNKQFKGEYEEFDSLRLQNLELIKLRRLREFGKSFDKRTNIVAQRLAAYCAAEKKKLRNLK